MKPQLDRRHREAMRHRGTQCLNCGHPLDRSDVYCPRCSQSNSNKPLSLNDFLSEFLGSILVYDSRLRHTLRDLLFHPGKITKNYVRGQRLKYANPFRFFLSVSIIYFLLVGVIEIVNSSTNDVDFIKINTTDAEVPDSGRRDDFMKPMVAGDTIKAKKLGIDHYLSEAKLDSLSFLSSLTERAKLYWQYHQTFPKTSPHLALETLNHENSIANRWVFSRMVAIKKITDNPRDFSRYLMAKMPFFLFFFTPLYALFFWMLYSRKKYTYMEHMIFIFHIFSFVFLAEIILTLLNLVFFKIDLGWNIIFLIALIYLYFALKRFYHQRHIITFLKFTFLIFIFTVGFLTSVMVFVAGSAAVY